MPISLQLCETYEPSCDDISGWYMSEKFDGQAALWDGQGGLCGRDGKPIQAPASWLAGLPPIALHGELWLRRGAGCLQELRSIVSKRGRLEPSVEEWSAVQFLAHSVPLQKSPNGEPLTYSQEFALLRSLNIGPDSPLRVIKQQRLPISLSAAQEQVEAKMVTVEAQGGEGVILRDPAAVWVPGRSESVLKYKILRLGEAVVVGYVAAKTGKYHGMIGALILVMENGIGFRVGQLLKDARHLHSDEGHTFAMAHPGKEMPEMTQSRAYPLGTTVQFVYRDLSARGAPLEPRLQPAPGQADG